MSTPDLCTRLDVTLGPDPSRVIVKLFVPGEDATQVRSRASAIVQRIANLDDDETARLLRRTLQRFGGRHHDLETTFRHHYDLVRHRVAPGSDLSPTPASWSAPISATSTRWRRRRCATRRWWPTPISAIWPTANSGS